MTLDLRLVLKAGLIWGVLAIVLLVIVQLVPLLPQVGIEGLDLASFATLFAGVHFSARNPNDKNIVVGLIGGSMAGIIAAVLMVVASLVLPVVLGSGAFTTTNIEAVLVPALIAGIAGALGMELVKRL
ncbi:MAG: hypothetical protein GYB64_17575 [Chloroflexi bacterium]|nr:hypothetical protein [Chloroflexota bacterium]